MKTILITGATDGLGKYVAGQLAREKIHLLLHGRDKAKLTALTDELHTNTSKAKIDTYIADLADLNEVVSLAQDISHDVDTIDVFINNAGVGFGEPHEPRQVSRQGYELRLAVNYLAPVLLMRLLRPLLIHAEQGRVINVASLGQVPIDFEDIMLDHEYSGITAYRRSKVALIMATFDEANALSGTLVTVNAIHPATFVATTMVIKSGVKPQSTLADGGEPIIRLALDPEMAQVTGKFYDQFQLASAIDQVYDQVARRTLAKVTEKLLTKYQ